MRKYYTRPCNFHYGSYAKSLITKKKGFPLAGNPNIAFDKFEIFVSKELLVINLNQIETTKMAAHISLNPYSSGWQTT